MPLTTHIPHEEGGWMFKGGGYLFQAAQGVPLLECFTCAVTFPKLIFSGKLLQRMISQDASVSVSKIYDK